MKWWPRNKNSSVVCFLIIMILWIWSWAHGWARGRWLLPASWELERPEVVLKSSATELFGCFDQQLYIWRLKSYLRIWTRSLNACMPVQSSNPVTASSGSTRQQSRRPRPRSAHEVSSLRDDGRLSPTYRQRLAHAHCSVSHLIIRKFQLGKFGDWLDNWEDFGFGRLDLLDPDIL